MILVVSEKDLAKAEKLLDRMDEPYFVIGTVVPRKARRPRVEFR
jgi:phosphoribosylformylglycinamidine (FGAM) synthase-like enzyme